MAKKLSEKLQDLKLELEKADVMLEKINDKGIYMFNFFNLCNDLLVVAHEDGYFILVNDAWTKATGFSAKELISKKWIDFVHPDDVTVTIDTGSALARKDANNFINRYVTKDGNYIKLSWSAKQTSDGLIYCCAKIIE